MIERAEKLSEKLFITITLGSNAHREAKEGLMQSENYTLMVNDILNLIVHLYEQEKKCEIIEIVADKLDMIEEKIFKSLFFTKTF